MGNCVKLKWNRRRLGMSQKAFADACGVSVGTIGRLETDETAWATIRAETEDRICAMFESMSSWQPERADKVLQDINNDTYLEHSDKPEVVVEYKPVVREEIVLEANRDLTGHDKKTLSLMQFAYSGLLECATHEDFAANMKIIKRIVEQY